MGFFGTYLHTDDWREVDPAASLPEGGGRWLWISIHDSDLATICYSPAGPGSGRAFVGYTPVAYFDADPGEGCADAGREALGLSVWAQVATGTSTMPGDVRALIVQDDDDPSDDAAFAEDAGGDLLRMLGLSVPWE